MNSRIMQCVLSGALLGIGLLCPLARALEAGAAKVDITPPEGTPLNGYGDRMGRNSQGVHDPLWARCLFLDDGETRVFLVNVDLCLINPALRARVLELAPEVTPKENIILTATHTHSGHGAMVEKLPFRAICGRFIPEVLEETASKIAASMRQAYEARRRAAIGYGVTKQTVLSANRRDSGGPIDEQIGVIGVEDADGANIAILTNFAAHPTSIEGDDFYQVSADYPGFYYTEIERLAEAGCIALFLNGALGNQTIGNPENKSGWERTESIGRLLAIRAKEVINEMTCTEATLRVTHRTATLPPTLAGFLPKTVFLQTLEINDLLLTFLPGEPCVEIGAALRRRALARGYKAQFTVGLANDYLMYFAPWSYYHRAVYESVQHYFGPGMEDWIYTQFEALMTRGTPPDAAEPEASAGKLEEIPGGLRLRLAGSPYSMGVARGKHFRTDIQQRFQDRICTPVESGVLRPESGLWGLMPAFMNPAPLALPVMGMASRPLLTGISTSLRDELMGLADGADLPFDAVWLLQNADRFHAIEDKSLLYAAPLCTMFAVSGDRAGADTLLVGRNLDWAQKEIPLITEMRPDSGHAFATVGFTWNAGVFSGMNDAGLVLCIERLASWTPTDLVGLPIEMLLRQVLQEAATVEEALAAVQAAGPMPGYHLLIAGFGEKGLTAIVLDLHQGGVVRKAEEGILLGFLPDSAAADPAAKSRYSRLNALLSEEHILDGDEIKRILADKEAGKSGMERICNPLTHHSIVFEPGARRMQVAFPAAAESRDYTRIEFAQGGARHE